MVALPASCPGCGALTQDVDRTEAGFFSASRNAVKAFIKARTTSKAPDRLITSGDETVLDEKSLPELTRINHSETEQPVCDRCHQLVHHNTGRSILHPSIESIKDTIAESPYKYNHVYHVVDAADFPLSLIPHLHQYLSLTRQRSHNRRSKTGRFYGDKRTEASFIITRSDLLAPQKLQVDSMMPYLVQVLRDALGPAGQDVRLGNVSCVSSRRGWWTQDLKEQVWTRGGGGWMVGKVNVGKSRLFESIYPKGRNQHVGFESLRVAAGRGTVGSDEADDLEVQRFAQTSLASGTDTDPKGQSDAFDETSLLPPSPSEVAYPVMPIVSPLPGTTASPIRLPFGDGKGELIDLPGLSRGDLDTYVRPEHRLDLVMCKRLKPAQHVLKPGQSLLLGGLIRITPTTPDMIVMAYPFVPLDAHVTSTTKAREIQRQERDSGVSTIVRPGVGETMNSAGVFELRWDVTKQRSGPLTRSDAAGLKADRLPYCVLSTDILVEGVGWVELVAQVRRKMSQGESQRYPAVEVFSPDGEYIGQRRPMNAWLYSAEGPRSSEKKSRPRPSMKGRKKGMKGAKRMPEI